MEEKDSTERRQRKEIRWRKKIILGKKRRKR